MKSLIKDILYELEDILQLTAVLILYLLGFEQVCVEGSIPTSFDLSIITKISTILTTNRP